MPDQFSYVRPTSVAGDNPDVRPAAFAFGDRVALTANHQFGSDPNIQQAGLWSTEEYVDPSLSRKKKLLAQQAEEGHVRPQCIGNLGTGKEPCKGFASPTTLLCGGHSKAAAKAQEV